MMPRAVPLSLAMLLAAVSLPCRPFEVAEFKSGMAKAEVLQKLATQWNFDKVEEPSEDTILAYDVNTQVNRRYLFSFCKGKLTGFEQDIKPSLKALVIVTANNNNKYGQPAKVYANTHMVSNGEKHVYGLFWKHNLEYVGAKYLILPDAEQLSLSFDVNNLCYATPRF